jgi:hypothetical protein
LNKHSKMGSTKTAAAYYSNSITGHVLHAGILCRRTLEEPAQRQQTREQELVRTCGQHLNKTTLTYMSPSEPHTLCTMKTSHSVVLRAMWRGSVSMVRMGKLGQLGSWFQYSDGGFYVHR